MDLLGTCEAKEFYFLESKDLKRLPYEPLGGGIGCGRPMKLYEPADLKRAAIEKWGVEGLKKKRAARAKRMENKRKKELAAAAAEEAFEEEAQQKKNDENARPQGGGGASKRAKTTDSATGAPKSNEAAIRKLRQSLLRMAKRKLRFTRAGGPDKWRTEVPATTAETFAALMGRPQDTTLKSFVKNGAYYSEDATAQDFFQCSSEDDLTRFFSREGMGIQIGEEIIVKYKPSTMDLSVSGYGEIAPF